LSSQACRLARRPRRRRPPHAGGVFEGAGPSSAEIDRQTKAMLETAIWPRRKPNRATAADACWLLDSVGEN